MRIERQQLSHNVCYEQTAQHIRLFLPGPCSVLSSGVFNGGFVEAETIINMKVAKRLQTSRSHETPEESLGHYAEAIGCAGKTVGMMTAASMESLSVAREEMAGQVLAVLVTSGLSNPRRAGDSAEYPYPTTMPPPAGTINTIIYSSLALTAAAMVETIMIAAEAKAAVMQDFGVVSPLSKKIATGTGTDAIALACGKGSSPLKYAGKHVLFGEVLARLVIEATSASIRWEIKAQGKRDEFDCR